MALINLVGNRLGIVGDNPAVPFDGKRKSAEPMMPAKAIGSSTHTFPVAITRDTAWHNTNKFSDESGQMGHLSSDQVVAYTRKPEPGQSLSMEIERDDKQGEPLISVEAVVISNVHIKSVVSNHENGEKIRTDFERSTPTGDWNKITVNGHSKILSNGLRPIDSEAPLADFVLGLLVSNFAAHSVSSKLNSLKLNGESNVGEWTPDQLTRPRMGVTDSNQSQRTTGIASRMSRTERRRVSRELGLVQNPTPNRGTPSIPSQDYPIWGRTLGRPAGLPSGPAVPSGASKPAAQREPNDCCIGQNLTCSLGNPLGKHTIKFGVCGTYKIDILDCCVKHDTSLFCGDGIDLPEPLSFVTALPEIELWMIAIAAELAACVSAKIIAAMAEDWPWYCGSFIVGTAIAAVISAVITVGVIAALWIAPHELVWGWFMGDPVARSQIALDGDHDHCCLCGGHEATWCCNESSKNKTCRDLFGRPRPLCGDKDCTSCMSVCNYVGDPKSRNRLSASTYWLADPNKECCPECCDDCKAHCPTSVRLTDQEIADLEANNRFYDFRDKGFDVFTITSEPCPTV